MIKHLVIPISIHEVVKEEFDEESVTKAWAIVRKWIADHCYIFVGHPDGDVTILPSDKNFTRKDFSKLTLELITLVKKYEDYRDLIITLAHGVMFSITDARNMIDITIKPEQVLSSRVKYSGDGVALIFFELDPNGSADRYVF